MGRSITIDDLYQLKFVSRPRISPDGQRIAYVQTTIDEQKHEYHSEIWIASLQDQQARRFTSGPANAHSPSWSPDGLWLAFVSERAGEGYSSDLSVQKTQGKGKPQIWVMPTDGGEARQVTYMQHGAASPAWSPDSQQLTFNALVGPADEETAEGKPLPKVRVIDRLWYRLDGVGFINERRSHLFLVDRTGGEPRQLTDGDWDDSEAVWSPDGTRIAFTSNHNEDRWQFPGDDVYVLDLQSSEPRRLTDGKLGCSSPSWSPDGQQLAFLAAPKVHAAGQLRMYRIAADAQDTVPTCLSSDFVGAFADWTNSDVGDEHLAPAPAWSADGQTLYAVATYRGASQVFALSSQGENTDPPVLTPGEVHVRDLSIDAASQRLALLVGGTTLPQEIFVRSLAPQAELQRVSHANDALLDEIFLAHPERIIYTGADGWEIEGWILKPQNFEPAHKYPLVVEIHGGPNTGYGYGFFHEMQLLAAQGYVVFYCNPRGSLGYGYDFADAVRNAWGEKDSIDIMMGMEEVIKRGYIDEQRLAVTGGSYGGFMTNWLVGHYDRFKVAITDRCVSNMATMFGTSDIGWDLASDVLSTTPWESLESYMHMSPISYVQNIHTPLLIIHSEQDLRCNIEQAEQLFAALKWLGRDVKFVRFEGQSHGLSRGGHPKLRQVRLQHILDWFATYLA
ncbi:S9 family peptidase [Dictyobacter aurantiacus]|uniref:Putative peptidase YuxL n=1 Tax=Dictyobacter aurantiacus TaxID=1936993 RepID=A0A401Z8I6_9CHLR|nr:S9 family peptidase [Dictyobacter aurantiacus]GCE03149.1 putative peptidase YuxL [Dictyobacter aurantiacus]